MTDEEKLESAIEKIDFTKMTVEDAAIIAKHLKYLSDQRILYEVARTETIFNVVFCSIIFGTWNFFKDDWRMSILILMIASMVHFMNLFRNVLKMVIVDIRSQCVKKLLLNKLNDN